MIYISKVVDISPGSLDSSLCVIQSSLSHSVLASTMGRVNVRCLCPIETLAITKTVMRSMGLGREAAYAPWLQGWTDLRFCPSGAPPRGEKKC